MVTYETYEHYYNEYAYSESLNILLDRGGKIGLVFNETSASRKFIASSSLIRDILILLQCPCS